MSEEMYIKELMAEKRQLEKKIRELKRKDVVFNRAKFSCHRYARGDEWYVAIFQDDNVTYKGLWHSIIKGYDKRKVIEDIDNVIGDLKGLKEMLKGE